MANGQCSFKDASKCHSWLDVGEVRCVKIQLRLMASKDCAIFLKRCKIHVKSLKRVNHHVIFGGFYFIFAWRTIINKHEPLDCRSYGVV